MYGVNYQVFIHISKARRIIGYLAWGRANQRKRKKQLTGLIK